VNFPCSLISVSSTVEELRDGLAHLNGMEKFGRRRREMGIIPLKLVEGASLALGSLILTKGYHWLIQNHEKILRVVKQLMSVISVGRSIRAWVAGWGEDSTLKMLEETSRTSRLKYPPRLNLVPLPWKFEDIVAESGKRPEFMRRRLRRYEDRGLMHEVRDGLEPRPRAGSASLPRSASEQIP
jgi:hypothetical protein